MRKHENTNDRSSQNRGTPKFINRVDLGGAKPATTGFQRGGLAPLANYVGGRLDGQITHPGFHDLFRDEFGKNLDGRCIPASRYRLYLDGCNLRYVHNSIIANHVEDPPE